MKLSAFLCLFFTAGIALPCVAAAGADTAWLSSWSASPQAVWSSDFILPANVPARLHDQTVRQVARVSVGGQRVRIVLSNAHGGTPLRIGAATVALSAGGSAIVPDSLRSITFAGRDGATIAPGAPLVSDPITLAVPGLARLTVSIHLPQDTAITTFHWDGRETAWIVPGQQTGASKLDTTRSITTTARLLLSSIEVEATAATQAMAVAVLGDSISDGAGASLGRDTRWPDVLAERLAPHGVAVINAGISGSRLLADGMGSNALARFERDVLAQPGVRTVIV